jgi:hypothetical protein
MRTTALHRERGGVARDDEAGAEIEAQEVNLSDLARRAGSS